jgi:hypothetical protein
MTGMIETKSVGCKCSFLYLRHFYNFQFCFKDKVAQKVDKIEKIVVDSNKGFSHQLVSHYLKVSTMDDMDDLEKGLENVEKLPQNLVSF